MSEFVMYAFAGVAFGVVAFVIWRTDREAAAGIKEIEANIAQRRAQAAKGALSA